MFREFARNICIIMKLCRIWMLLLQTFMPLQVQFFIFRIYILHSFRTENLVFFKRITFFVPRKELGRGEKKKEEKKSRAGRKYFSNAPGGDE